MSWSPQFDRVRQLFADQFEADGDGYLFRKNLAGPAVQVSAGERDAFVAQFNRSYTHLTWGFIAALLVFLAALIVWALRVNSDQIAMPIYVGSGLLVALFMLAWSRAWRAPAQALADRAATAPALSKDEAKRAAMQRLTWPRIGGTVAGFAAALFVLSQRIDLLAGWNRLLLVFAVVGFAGVAYRAFRKWRFEQTGRVD